MQVDADKDVVFKGSLRSIAYAVCADESRPAKAFLEALDASDKRKMRALFERLGNMGVINNREKFKHVEGKIFGFKSFQIRMGCFQEGMTWFLTHGFIKKDHEWRQEEIDRAQTIRSEHLARQRQKPGDKK